MTVGTKMGLSVSALLILTVACLVATFGVVVDSKTASVATATQALSEAPSLIDVEPVRTIFQRALDLDGDEHSYLITTFTVANNARKEICNFKGQAVLETGRLERSTRATFFLKLQPNEHKPVDVNFQLNPSLSSDVVFMDLPLRKITARWTTKDVTFCDGTSYSQ